MDSFFSFSEPLNQGIDFYTGDVSSSATLSIESSLLVSVTKIIHIASAIDGSADTSASAIKIAYAQANLAVDGATVVVGRERHDALVTVSAEANVSITITKIAFASTSVSGDASLSASGTEIVLASSTLSGSADTSASMSKTAFAAAALSSSVDMTTFATSVKLIASSMSGSVNLSVMGKIVLVTARLTILSNTSITAQALRFSTGITADSGLIRSLLLINGKALTNQTRTLDISAAPIYVENINWAGDTSRYYKNSSSGGGAKRTFNVRWSFIPNFQSKTVDLRESRDYIRTIANDPDVHTLTIINQDESGLTPYTEENINVFVTNFSESLIRRDLIDGVYYFDCTLALEEV